MTMRLWGFDDNLEDNSVIHREIQSNINKLKKNVIEHGEILTSIREDLDALSATAQRVDNLIVKNTQIETNLVTEKRKIQQHITDAQRKFDALSATT